MIFLAKNQSQFFRLNGYCVENLKISDLLLQEYKRSQGEVTLLKSEVHGCPCWYGGAVFDGRREF